MASITSQSETKINQLYYIIMMSMKDGGDDYNVRYLFIVIVDHFGNWREFLTSFDSLVK